MMDWRRLFSTRRFGHSGNEEPKPVRSAFQKDWDRVVFSSAFRRLQDKTQVHSLPESDYVRTRLTHSLEASSVGRSLGAGVGVVVLQRRPRLAEIVTAADFGHVVSAACLAHDIGNPPFGHHGEATIRHWFANGEGRGLIAGLAPAERRDFELFEGNAQGFRILARLQNWRHAGGLRLTAATLATFMKYPRASDATGGGAEEDAGARKFGYFQAEAALFQSVAETVGLLADGAGAWLRHPLAFLVEAADDICYRIVDLEDGCKLGRVAFRDAEELLLQVIGERPARYREVGEEPERIGYLRAKAIGHLVERTVASFLEREEAVMSGRHRAALLEGLQEAPALAAIEKLTRERVFRTIERTQNEIAGGEVIRSLVAAFAGAVVEEEMASEGRLAMSPRAEALLRLMPGREKGGGRYARLLAVTDFVSGMTDSYAINQSRLIGGLLRP
ncbi:MAG: deoxyguanosinetriphosphate triphosphohydrolase [Alphaproteobacteria bacterium]|nr:deoxyguanosinetriphosphate triphosphohydrolase [Alphaproteobacteria bacterium]